MQLMSPVYFDAGVRISYTVFIAKCQSYDGRYLVPSGLISPNIHSTVIPF